MIAGQRLESKNKKIILSEKDREISRSCVLEMDRRIQNVRHEVAGGNCLYHGTTPTAE